MEQIISDVLGHNHQFKYVVIGMESTGFYGVHLANHLSASDLLAPFSVRVYCLNPKEVKNYKKSFNDTGKNGGIDSYVIADFARVGRIAIKPCLTTFISSSVNTHYSVMGSTHSQTDMVPQLKSFLLSTQRMKIS